MKNKPSINKEKRRLNRRIGWVRILFLGAIMGLIVKVGYIKFVQGASFEKEVLLRVSGTEKEIDAQRGKIVDRNGKTIATSVLTYDIFLDCVGLLQADDQNIERTYEELAQYTQKSKEDIKNIVAENASSRYKILVKNISIEDMEMLREKKLAGIGFKENYSRRYPRKEFAAQTIGFLNKEGEGQYGIEQYYNQSMLGTTGRIFPKLQEGSIVTTEIVSPKNGNTIVLTLDEVVQQYVEQTMDKYVKQENPLNAAAIVMNPNTGEIYAMYSYPNFNPENYTDLSEQMGATWKEMEVSEQSALLNRAWRNFNIQNPYEPGSTFKPTFIAAAIEEGIITPDTQFNCTGSMGVADTTIPCWRRAGHGIQNVEQALANSCNVAMIQVTEKMSANMFYKYMVKYGFGELTHIDLAGEQEGILHNEQDFGPVQRATSAMGQSFTCTPVQLLSAFSSVINGGNLLEPHVVSQIINTDGEVTYEAQPKIRRKVLSKETSSYMRQALRSVVTSGTGKQAAVTGYMIGGKTGTAQKRPLSEGKLIQSFIGYAPIDKPEVIVLTLFDEIPEGNHIPASAFHDMMINILPYLEVPTDYTGTSVEASTVAIPDVTHTDIYTAIEALKAESLDYELVGVGNQVTMQYPEPGVKLPADAMVKLYVETDQPENVLEVPDLIGKTIEEAMELIGSDWVLIGPGTGTITQQTPYKGVKLERNSKIIVETTP